MKKAKDIATEKAYTFFSHLILTNLLKYDMMEWQKMDVKPAQFVIRGEINDF
ncbi:MAG: hypothetical protein LKG36_05890 [[Lactobacillus] timonensis]|jgi:hypothetical protein|nr:hypothetical protein [[Lactobacillus] timonensis]